MRIETKEFVLSAKYWPKVGMQGVYQRLLISSLPSSGPLPLFPSPASDGGNTKYSIGFLLVECMKYLHQLLKPS